MKQFESNINSTVGKRARLFELFNACSADLIPIKTSLSHFYSVIMWSLFSRCHFRIDPHPLNPPLGITDWEKAFSQLETKCMYKVVKMPFDNQSVIPPILVVTTKHNVPLVQRPECLES